jgi:hypothetical protein
MIVPEPVLADEPPAAVIVTTDGRLLSATPVTGQEALAVEEVLGPVEVHAASTAVTDIETNTTAPRRVDCRMGLVLDTGVMISATMTSLHDGCRNALLCSDGQGST